MHIAKVLLSKLLYENHKSDNDKECCEHLCMTCKYKSHDFNELPCNMCFGIHPTPSYKCFWKSSK